MVEMNYILIQETKNLTIVANRKQNSQGYLSLPSSPCVSFIVLSFNNEKYLTETLKSIIEQSFLDIEIIIADDGSTDSSANIIKKFVETCPLPCIAVLWADNGGIGRNYNSALKCAQGEFIAHIGSDDINYPNRLELEVDALMTSSASMCISGMEIIDSASNKIRNVSARTECHTLKYALATGMIHVTSPTMMYRREIVDRFGFLPAGLANEDEALAFRAICTKGILVLNEILVRYRLHSGSIQFGARSKHLSIYLSWLQSNLPFQIANKEHWKDILRSTFRYEMIPSVDALLLALESKREKLQTLSNLGINLLLLRLLATTQGRSILRAYAMQQIRNARNAWLRILAPLRCK